MPLDLPAKIQLIFAPLFGGVNLIAPNLDKTQPDTSVPIYCIWFRNEWSKMSPIFAPLTLFRPP